MVLIGAGQGLAFAPLTSFGIAGVPAEDAGAATGLVNTAHQLGMAPASRSWSRSPPDPRRELDDSPMHCSAARCCSP